MKSARLLLGILFVALLSPPPSAVAGDPSVSPNDDGLLVEVEESYGSAPSPSTGGDSSDTTPTYTQPVIDLGDELFESFCGGTNYTEGCEPEPAEPGVPAEPTLTLGMITTAFREVPLPAARVRMEPPGGRTLVNWRNNFHTESAPLTRVVTLLGRRITLDITPTSWTWRFGDGTTHTSATPGAPYPAFDVEHTYRRAGSATLSVTTTYSATFSVDGGPSQPVPGTVSITGPGSDLTVREARHQLADTR